MWISKQEYRLLNELKTAAEHKAQFFESLNVQLSRENRRLIERLLAKNNIPLVESPDNVIQKVVEQQDQVLAEDMNLFEDEMGDPVIPRDSKEERKLQEESDTMEYQP